MPRRWGPRCRAVLLIALLVGCGQPNLPPVPQYDPATLAAMRFKAVLAAGDAAGPDYDNAVVHLGRALAARGGVRAEDIYRLSADDVALRDKGIYASTVQGLLETIEDLKPGAGEGCLVFVTGPGEPGSGLVFPRSRGSKQLDPERLDRALASGCGNAPTVLVLSGCATGHYLTPSMRRANRIVIVADRGDSAAAVCSLGREYTVFDECLLQALDGLGVGMTWLDAFTATRNCVQARAVADQAASAPAVWVGPVVTGMPLPWRR